MLNSYFLKKFSCKQLLPFLRIFTTYLNCTCRLLITRCPSAISLKKLIICTISGETREWLLLRCCSQLHFRCSANSLLTLHNQMLFDLLIVAHIYNDNIEFQSPLSCWCWRHCVAGVWVACKSMYVKVRLCSTKKGKRGNNKAFYEKYCCLNLFERRKKFGH